MKEIPADLDHEEGDELDRMSLLQHLDELRRRITISVAALTRTPGQIRQ